MFGEKDIKTLQSLDIADNSQKKIKSMFDLKSSLPNLDRIESSKNIVSVFKERQTQSRRKLKSDSLHHVRLPSIDSKNPHFEQIDSELSNVSIKVENSEAKMLKQNPPLLFGISGLSFHFREGGLGSEGFSSAFPSTPRKRYLQRVRCRTL